MRKSIFTLLVVLIILTVSVYATGLVYSLIIKYDNGVLSVEDLKLMEGTAPDRSSQPEEGYLAKVISFNNETLYSFKFRIELTPLYIPPPEWFDENGTQIVFPNETLPKLTETTVGIIIPYYRNAKSIDIYTPNNEFALSVNVSNYATCNLNSVCDMGETNELCPEDCTIKKLLSLNWMVLLLIILSSIVIGALYYKNKLKSKARYCKKHGAS